jgi:hypothetical protein
MVMNDGKTYLDNVPCEQDFCKVRHFPPFIEGFSLGSGQMPRTPQELIFLVHYQYELAVLTQSHG